MDPLSVAASVLVVVTTATSVLTTLEKIRGFRRAPKEVWALIDEVSDLKTVLGSVDKLFRYENRRRTTVTRMVLFWACRG